MPDGRLKRTTIANIRQHLQAPAEALVEYSNILLEQAKALEVDEILPDLKRISIAANQMTDVVDSVLSEQGFSEFKTNNNTEHLEHVIRHELRTPINAIKGYSEMLMEDLFDLGAQALGPDLERMLVLADKLLTDINSYMELSNSDIDAEGGIDAVSAALSNELIQSIQALECEGDQCPTEPIETNVYGHILVVDDIESNRDLLSRRLIKDGHTTATASGGAEALALLQQNEFDLVLLDLMMPDMNGYQVLTAMRNDKQLRHIPVMMISALEETDSVIRCIEAGAIDYLQKPFNPILLKARINSGLLNKQWSDDERNQRRFIKQAFSRFVSPAVVNQLLEQPDKLSLGGERVEISCVFTDLSGFTSAIEGAEPTEIMPVLNHYLSALCNIAMEHDGTIDKIIGDAVYIFFNAPVAREDHAEASVRCAMAIQEWSNKFMQSDQARRFKFGKTRIGVHTGSAIVGNFGGDTFFNYTAYGDTVNTTARLESANKHLGTDICISGETVRHCSDIEFRLIGELLLKGKLHPVETYTLVDSANFDAQYLAQYAAAIEGLKQGSENLEASFRTLIEKHPNDPLCQFHWQRIQSGDISETIVLSEK